ncbi:MAG: twin-arginine translocase TatA/TatE family subunit [Verrucomicrobia bacterium]|nr:MAG: twin-arginine translocase TatA/TatE family subunit [Verrucomicrobiota bacterium]
MTLSLLALLGTGEIIIIALVVLVLFGARKVPELMKGVGTGIREFKKASRDVQDEFARASAEEPPAPAPAPAAPRKAPETVSQDVGHS